jgi:hypothetical protein
LNEARVFGALDECVDAVERVGAAAAGGCVTGLGPLIDHGERESEAGGHLLGTVLLKYFAQEFV